MAELEEKLNAILSDPQAMGRILSMAQALSGQEVPASAEHQEPEPPLAQDGDLFSALGQLDPQLIQLGMELLSEYTTGDDRKTALLTALKPFLRPERQAKVDQAVKIAKLSRLIRTALRFFQGRSEEEQDV